MTRYACLAVLAALCLAACAGGGAKGSPTPPPQTMATITVPPAPPSTVAAPGVTEGPSAVAEIGIPECDSYVRKYEACVQRHAPASERIRLQQALDQSRAAWRAAATQPQGRGMLASMCQQAETAAKTSLGAYGCQW